MTTIDRLTAALSDRYRIERELGAERFPLQGVPTVHATDLKVITNFPRFVAEKLRGAK